LIDGREREEGTVYGIASRNTITDMLCSSREAPVYNETNYRRISSYKTFTMDYTRIWSENVQHTDDSRTD